MERFPPMPLEEWSDSKATMHRFLQVVGKIRLAASARRNHWWNVPFHLTGRGLTTRPMGGSGGLPSFTIDFDLVDHQLLIYALDGRAASFPLAGKSVAEFYAATMATVHGLGLHVDLAVEHPFGLPDDSRPFELDTEHAAYDPAWITRYWQVLTEVSLVLEAFSARFSGKVSPVHHFWHTMDIAVTRFSDRVIELPARTDPVTREAYSREVISAGFWFGDDDFPEAAFYSYTAPEPDGLALQPLRPAAAEWTPLRGSDLAVLRYADVRTAADPAAEVLAFLESAYRAGARLAGWDVARYASPGGVTDPAIGDPMELARTQRT
jgi:hypothetical protein